jgi:hypothetical protein
MFARPARSLRDVATTTLGEQNVMGMPHYVSSRHRYFPLVRMEARSLSPAADSCLERAFRRTKKNLVEFH